MLNRLHSTVNRGSTDSEWLKQRLDNFAKTTISFEDDRYVGVAGSLVGSFRIDKTTKEAVIRTNPELRALWESITHLDIDQRRSLGQNQLAKAMRSENVFQDLVTQGESVDTGCRSIRNRRNGHFLAV